MTGLSHYVDLERNIDQSPIKSSVPTALLISFYQFEPGNKLPGYYIVHARPDDQSDGPMAFGIKTMCSMW